MTYSIYRLHCEEHQLTYIGVTSKSLEERFKRHCRDARKKVNRKIANALLTYGSESFKIELLEVVHDVQTASDREKLWIDHYNSCKEGLNCNGGGIGKFG